jgi:hypothetical protein
MSHNNDDDDYFAKEVIYKDSDSDSRTNNRSDRCFVATAVYSDINHPDVVFLRWFRDNVLINYEIGRIFIGWYWCVGPKLAHKIELSQTLKSITKFHIKNLTFILRKFL